MHTHNHDEGGHAHTADRPLKLSLAIVLIVMVAEIVGGLLSNSLALLSDAGHMLVDAFALALSLFATTVARRPATSSKTFGYYRAEIIAALVNGTVLGFVAAFIFYEAYQRILTPAEVEPPIMLAVAVVGLAANFAQIFLMRQARHISLNIKAAFWHIVGDTISSVGVVTAGIIILLTGQYIADAIVAIFIGVIILWGAIQIVKEAIDILLESTPRHIKVEDVVSTIQSVPGVREVHDIHIWTISSGIYALSAHLLIEDQTVGRSADIIEAVNHSLAERFNIRHTNLQLECTKCETCSAGTICRIDR